MGGAAAFFAAWGNPPARFSPAGKRKRGDLGTSEASAVFCLCTSKFEAFLGVLSPSVLASPFRLIYFAEPGKVKEGVSPSLGSESPGMGPGFRSWLR